jgi:integrase
LKSDGTPISADTHHLLLRRVKNLYRWALCRKLVKDNPFAEVRPVGRPRRGKPQLRIDEARKFVTVALKSAGELDVGATAALLQIFLGLRPTESVVRVVRDLDDGGRVLWIPFGKTQNARRRLLVPDTLRPILLRHAENKPPDAPLLGPPGEGMHTRFVLRYRVKQLCQAAGVPSVCPHSLRGLNATLALEAGATAQHVAAALGHASFATTARHYADASTVVNVSLRKVANLLAEESCREAPPDVRALARLLRSHLTEEELQSLRLELDRR